MYLHLVGTLTHLRDDWVNMLFLLSCSGLARSLGRTSRDTRSMLFSLATFKTQSMWDPQVTEASFPARKHQACIWPSCEGESLLKIKWRWGVRFFQGPNFPVRSSGDLKSILERITWHLPHPSQAMIRSSSWWSTLWVSFVPHCFGRGNVRAEIPWETWKIPHHLTIADGNPEMIQSWSHSPRSIHFMAI